MNDQQNQAWLSKQSTISAGLLLAALALAFTVASWTADKVDRRFARLETKLDTVSAKLSSMSALLDLHLAETPTHLARSPTNDTTAQN